MAQIREAHPHHPSAGHALSSPIAAVTAGDERPVAEDLVGRSFDDRIAEWWSSLTENLSQTTFFLLDPESWR
jgi:hypothetical protein